MFNENTLSKDEGSQSEGKAEITPNSVDKGTDRTDQAKQAPKGSEEAIAVAAIDVLFIGGGIVLDEYGKYGCILYSSYVGWIVRVMCVLSRIALIEHHTTLNRYSCCAFGFGSMYRDPPKMLIDALSTDKEGTWCLSATLSQLYHSRTPTHREHR